MPSDDPAPFDKAIHAETGAVLASTAFKQSPVLSRLLQYLVDQTLAGRGDALKAYTVAVEGLGRPSSFDAEADSYPRVQVGRLRRLLSQHYAARPRQSRNCLYVPTGAYRVFLGSRENAYPELGAAAEAEPGAFSPVRETGDAPRASRWSVPVVPATVLLIAAILVAGWFMWTQTRPAAAKPVSPLIKISAKAAGDGATLADSAASIIADGLRRSWVVRVGGRDATSEEALNYWLEVEAVERGNSDRLLYLRLVDPASNAVIWSNDVKVASGDENLKNALAQSIAELGAPTGVIGTAARRRFGKALPGYLCLIHYSAYYRTREPALRAEVQRCLDQSSPEPHLQPMIDSARGLMLFTAADDPAARAAALGRASTLARRALAAQPDSSAVLGQNALVALYGGQCASAKAFARKAMVANPYDVVMAGATGVLMSQCDRRYSRELLDRARWLEPDGAMNFTVPLIVLAAEDNDQAKVAELMDGIETNADSSPAMRALAHAIAAASAGDRRGARAFWARVIARTPGEFASDDELLRRYIFSDGLRKVTANQLRKGGIVISKTRVTAG